MTERIDSATLAGHGVPSIDHRNNFDLIRLFGAVQVMLTHGVSALGRDSSGWFWRVMAVLPGVPIFFVTSGFLVAASLDRSDTIGRYARNRALRIFPALWVCFIVTLGLLGIAGQLDSDFLSSTFVPWVVAQLTIGQSYNPGALRDFGNGVINGSLWTIPVELAFYVALPVAMAISRWRRGKVVVVVAIAASMVIDLLTESRGTFFTKLISVSPVAHIWLFLCGMLAYEYRKFIIPRVSGRFIPLFAIYLVVALGLYSLDPLWLELGFPLLGLVVLAAAYTAPTLSTRLLRRNDVSYGVYIYHMLVVNALLGFGYATRSFAFPVLIVSTAVLATLSWMLVERPALRLKKRRDQSLTQPAIAT